MKEIIVIEDRDLVNHYKNSFGSKAKLVSIPETFEELKEMCEKLSNKTKYIQVSIEEDYILIQLDNDDDTDIDIYDDGTIIVEQYVVATNLTPNKMWERILFEIKKRLLEEI